MPRKSARIAPIELNEKSNEIRRNSISQGHAFPHYLEPSRKSKKTACDIEKAKRFRDISTPRHKKADGTYEDYSILSYPLRKMQDYGIGNYLYFKTLQRLGLLFFFVL